MMSKKKTYHALLLWIAFCVHPALASNYVVNSVLDLPDADPSDSACATSPPPVCTLRAAVMQANAHAGPDYISLPAGTYVLSRVGYDTTASLGDLDITDDVTISATGGTAVIDANRSVTFDRAFEVIAGSLSLQNITLKNGYSPSYGGAIYAKGNLTLTNVSVLDNMAALDGGGIDGDGSNIQITASTFQGNIAQGSGGAINLQGSASPYPTLWIVGSTIAGNQALGSGYGGGANAYTANIVVQTSNVHDNSAAYSGGGLSYIAAVIGVTMQISDSIFDHNAAGQYGGGLYSDGNDTTSNSVISNNSATGGGGVYGYFGTHNLNDVSISGNTASLYGGGIQVSSGNLNLLRDQVHGNSATQLGGGITAGGAGSIHLAVTDSNVFDNGASDGGGIYSLMKFNATSSAIYGNYASGRGGGVFASGSATAAIDNSIVDRNSAGSNGGGVFADSMATVKLDSATITGNYARTAGFSSPGTGGGIYVTAGASATATSSVLAYNTNSTFQISPNDCSGTLTLNGYAFVGSNSGCTVAIQAGTFGNSVGGAFPSTIDPQLSPFERLYDPALPASPNASAKYGRVPLSGSPLIDAGPPGGCQTGDGAYLFWDEIGQFRAINNRCDIGAIEFGAALDEIFGNGFDG